jgi:serine/threonine protein kinase
MSYESLFFDEDNLQKPLKPAYASETRIPINSGHRLIYEYKVGDLIDFYKIEEVINIGRWGNVYKCRDQSNNDIYALKTIKSNCTDQSIEKMMTELERMSNLPYHINIIPIHYAFLKNDIPHIVMHYARGVILKGKYYGTSLQQLIDNNYPFDINEILWIAAQICRGMWHCQASEEGFVHGDIKPDNILFDPLDQPMIDTGLFQYKIMLSDIGGVGKTPGFCLTQEGEPAQRADDIYGFAQTMRMLYEKFHIHSESPFSVWNIFKRGLDELVGIVSSDPETTEIKFSSLYNSYAEALEVVLGLNSAGYSAEDLLPRPSAGIRMEIVSRLNKINYYMQIKKDYDTIKVELEQLSRREDIDTIYFDELPVRILILVKLLFVYFGIKDWPRFDETLELIDHYLEKVKGPIKYNGVYIYSFHLDEDLKTVRMLSRLARGDHSQLETLLYHIKEHNGFERWIELLIPYLEDSKEHQELFEKRIVSLTDHLAKNTVRYANFVMVLGKYYCAVNQFDLALPYVQEAYEGDKDNVDLCYLYACCLYYTGKVIKSMMLFERVYDIYCLNHMFMGNNQGLILMALYSLAFMCDFDCLASHCNIILSLDRVEKDCKKQLEWLVKYSEDGNKMVEYWRTLEKSLNQEFKPDTFGHINGLRNILEENLRNKSSQFIYILETRHGIQVLMEVYRYIAKVYLGAEHYEKGIELCNVLLSLDSTNFWGYFYKGHCYKNKYEKDRKEEDQSAALDALRTSLEFVHAAYPGTNGEESKDAKVFIDLINQEIIKLKGEYE